MGSNKNTYEIKRSKISSLGGKIHYTVLRLNTKGNNDFYYDSYFMRTGSSIENAIKKATAEFKKRKLAVKEFEPEYEISIKYGIDTFLGEYLGRNDEKVVELYKNVERKYEEKQRNEKESAFRYIRNYLLKE